ncbi:penicillin-binding transpeptidase domain-containing protein [Tyzzerella sp. An114]|uniref:penicillin-binding transpeptidase domain-containing protein n=1 Tax=Tyzzerella sp. An114 TaxID=1965545 RepID=UPI001302D48C|nr:penicillin-binding transpeptidase domain-containing protein [Tyzzerella sp. An114]
MKKTWEKLSKAFCQEEENSKQKINTRLHKVYFVLGLIMIMEIGVLYINSGVVTGINKKADKYKIAAITEADINTIAAGDIFDRNGVTIVKSEVPKEGSVYNSAYIDDYAYSQVIGYTGKTKSVRGFDVVEEQGRDYRLMKLYNEELYETSNINGNKGSSLNITIDHNIQMKVMELLLNEMTIEDRGSAVVLDAKTGEVLSMVSLPSFNVNNINEGIKTMESFDKEKEIYYPITHKGAEVMGSIFKIITDVSIIDSGQENFTAVDSNFKIGDTDIVNDYGSVGDTINYHEATVRSSNVFFAKAVLADGGQALNETAEKFMIGKDIELDFGTINSNWDLDLSNNLDLAYTAFGQGKTLSSTIVAAMMTQAIANDGVMLKPYMIKSIVRDDGKVLQEGKTEVLSEVTSYETANKVTEAMKDAVKSYIKSVEGEENKEIYRKYNVAGKTGTGQRGDENNTNNAWFVSFAPADDPKYVVVVNQICTTKYGIKMMDTAAGIYEYLFNQN